MNKTPKHQNLVTKIQILAPFDLSFKQIKNQFSNFWNRADESEVQGEAAAPLVFKKKKKNENIVLLHKTELFPQFFMFFRFKIKFLEYLEGLNFLILCYKHSVFTVHI